MFLRCAWYVTRLCNLIIAAIRFPYGCPAFGERTALFVTGCRVAGIGGCRLATRTGKHYDRMHSNRVLV